MNRKNLAGLLSIGISVIFILGSFLSIDSFYSFSDDYLFVISVAIAVPSLIYGSMDYIEVQKIYSAEKKLPDLLRDLSNFTSFGIPLSEAFQRIRANSYGGLTSGVRKVSSLVSSGVGLDEAIRDLGSGIKSSKVAMVSKILQKSNESGSNTSDVIWILSEFTTQSELLRQSRIAEMKNYNLVMIISFAVFLFVILFLDIRFLQVMLTHGVETGSFIAGNLSSRNIENAFSVGVMTQAIAIGIISGILRDIRLSSGILLTGILIAATTVVFALTGVY